MTRPAITDLNPALLASNRAEIERQLRPRTIRVEHAPDLPSVPAKKRLRQHQGDGMNKTERAFFEYLKAQYQNATHIPQATSFRLANNSSYRPDFISITTLHDASECGSAVVRITAWETKGFAREAAVVRIKVAASLYRWISFRLVTRTKGGGWDVQEILP